jgi:hypothetical protein
MSIVHRVMSKPSQIENAYHSFRDLIRCSHPGTRDYISGDILREVLVSAGLSAVPVSEFVDYANSLGSRIVVTEVKDGVEWRVNPERKDVLPAPEESSLKEKLSLTLSALGWEKQSDHQFIWGKAPLCLVAAWKNNFCCLTILQSGNVLMDIRVSHKHSGFVLRLVKTWSDWMEVNHLLPHTDTNSGARTST